MRGNAESAPNRGNNWDSRATCSESVGTTYTDVNVFPVDVRNTRRESLLQKEKKGMEVRANVAGDAVCGSHVRHTVPPKAGLRAVARIRRKYEYGLCAI